ncbi:MAG TPA: PQQ-binding-like beta-propeller repeat protein [Thermoplasmata archaeon]|nr:PQQ-binding-like beta-propeller repeat protein [Thermoplasmata archaeon]
MRHVLPVFGAAIALVLLATPALAQDWPMAGGNAARTGVTYSEPSVFPATLWETSMGGALTSGPIVSAAGAVPLVLAVRSGPLTLVALRAADGASAWTVPLTDLAPPGWDPQGEPASPAADAGRVFLLFTAHNATTDRYKDVLVAVSRVGGAWLWSFMGNEYASPSDPGVRSSPLLAGSAVFFGSGDGNVRALALNGSLAWDKVVGAPVVAPVSLLATGNPLVGDFILAGDAAGTLHALDVQGLANGDQGLPDPAGTGDVVWETDLGAPVMSAPVGGRTAAFAITGSDVSALHPAFGSVNWSVVSGPAVTPLVATNTTVIVGGIDGWVRAHSASNGALVWAQSLGTLRPWMVATPTRLFTAAAWNATWDHVVALSPAAGTPTWSHALPAPASFGVIADKVLYVAYGSPARIAALAGQPDLAVRPVDVSITPSSRQDVFEASVDVTVRNAGDANASHAFRVDVYDVIQGTLTPIANGTFPYLKPGDAVHVTADAWSFVAGPHSIRVDVETVPGERDTTNNEASIAFYAAAGPPNIVYQWAPSILLAIVLVGAGGVGAGWLLGTAGRRRERALQAMLQEREKAGP